MRRLRSAAVRLVRERAGFTLIELITVMAILLIILVGLTTTLASGYRAEIDLNRRYQAQQEARLAADKMRREVHCADALTVISPSSVNVHIPALCPTAGGTAMSVVYDTLNVSSGRYQLRRNSVVIADYLTSGAVFSYVAASPDSLGKLHVSLPVDLTPADAIAAWQLNTDLVLRNTERA